MRARRRTPEADIQRSIVKDLPALLDRPFILHHSANESGKASRAAQGILTGMGVHAGFSDLLILAPERRALFLEVKAGRNTQSAAQRDFQADVEAFGWHYATVWSVLDAIDAAVRYGFATRVRQFKR